VGAGFPATLTMDVFGVPASELIDRIVPLEHLWGRDEVAAVCESLSRRRPSERAAALQKLLALRIGRAPGCETTVQSAARVIARHGGCVSIDHLARSYGFSRQRFARGFSHGAGLPPKLFARITRFQALVRALLSTDVSQWASLSPSVGFYDQAHMINEFREFAGSSPTVFFRPHDDGIAPERVRLRGRPSEWYAPDAATDSRGVKAPTS
jgi:methylphosphotriester-DNA--protein-cysteine methyltransferase